MTRRPAEALLELLQLKQKFTWFEPCERTRHGIHEVRLSNRPERPRAIERRDADDVRLANLVQLLHGKAHLRRRVIDIAADADIDGLPEAHRLPSYRAAWPASPADTAPHALRPGAALPLERNRHLFALLG